MTDSPATTAQAAPTTPQAATDLEAPAAAPGETKQSTPFIVVGVDGSISSIEALKWAAAQAKLTGAELRAVTAWHMPTAYGAPVGGLGSFDPGATAREVLDEALAKADLSLAVTTEVWQGISAAVLLDASKGAELLVVGRRGHGELVGALLGSVSAYVVAHAHCPVVVIRHSHPDKGH